MKPLVPALAIATALATASWSGGRSAELTLSIDITQPVDEPYEQAIEILRTAGAHTTSLSLFWDEMEPETGRYSPEVDWPAIANAYYPSEGFGLTLTFSVIDTVTDRRRRDFRTADWDDPDLIEAFSQHLRDVMVRMPDTDILTISIGNEIDGLLQTDAEIAAFSRFLTAARRTLDAIHPGMPIGAKLTFAALSRHPERWRPIIESSTALHITYYPMDSGFEVRGDLVVADDLDRLIGIANGLPIYILEAGYPSDGCGAGPGGQLSFVRELLLRGAERSDRIRLISLTWLTDIPAPEVAVLSRYYGVASACFERYLASLGLRTREGAAKPALLWLQQRR